MGASAPKRAKRYLRYQVIRAALWIAARLPLASVPSLAKVMGGLGWALFRAERRKALESLAVAFPGRSPIELEAIGAAMFVHLSRCALELAVIDQIDARMESWVEFPDAERATFDAAVAEGKGIIFVSGHIGNWELLARRFARAGYSCATIAKESNDARLTGLIERIRQGGQLKTIWRGAPGAAKDMLRQLKKGGVLGLLIDQDTKVQGVFVDFFGRRAFTPRAAADLALRSGAPAIAGFIRRVPGGGHRIHVERVAAPTEQEGEAAVVEFTQRLTRAIESTIRDNPVEWVWMHRRWKTRPPEELVASPLGQGN